MTGTRRGLELPGMDVGGAGAFADAARLAPNRWAIVASPAGREVVAEVLRIAASTSGPAHALEVAAGTPVGASGCDLVLLSMELDSCGTWFTLANAGGPRPVVVRRAGWVDVRGHHAAVLGGVGPPPADDRVGLGPGDALVLLGPSWHARTGAGGTVDEVVLDALLDAAGQPAEALTAALDAVPGARAGDAVVIAVPGDLGDDPVERVAAATGTPRHELELPGYPLGDAQPDLWHAPPRPPRLARVRVDGDAAVVAEVRQLLRRLLASWRIEERVGADDIELLASEVTTNAIRHAGTRARTVVRYLGDRLRVEVHDESPARPVRRDPGDDSTGGRGLPLVDALASDWGVDETPEGKRVWFEVVVAD